MKLLSKEQVDFQFKTTPRHVMVQSWEPALQRCPLKGEAHACHPPPSQPLSLVHDDSDFFLCRRNHFDEVK